MRRKQYNNTVEGVAKRRSPMVNKGVIVVGSLAVAGGLVFALSRKAEAASPDEPGEGTIDIVILGPDGQPVPQV